MQETSSLQSSKKFIVIIVELVIEFELFGCYLPCWQRLFTLSRLRWFLLPII